MLEQQQREEGARLRGIRQQLDDEAGEADRLLLQVEPQQPVTRRGEVSLVVHEHEHREHAAETFRQVRG